MRSALTDGIHRVSFTVDDKLHAFHAAETPRGVVLFDTGVPDTPEGEFAPFLAELGYDSGTSTPSCSPTRTPTGRSPSRN